MKKVLFATTALIATASMAAAEVKISGYGRFGIDYNSGGVMPNIVVGGPGGAGIGWTPSAPPAPGVAPLVGNSRATNGIPKTTITSRLRLQFDMSAQTDSGVAFDARLRAQAESRDNAPLAAVFNAARFGVSYEGFRVNVGNIIGAIEGMPGLYLETRTGDIGIDGAGFVSLVTNVNNEYFNWDAYSSAGVGANGVEAMYSAGGLGIHVSYSTDNGPVAVDRVGGRLSYKFGDWTAAIAAQSSDIAWEDKVVVSVQGNLGAFGVRVAYADNDGIGKWGLYGNYDISPASNILLWVTDEEAVSAADVGLGRNDNRDAVAISNQQEGTSWGIHYSYDLGGGASFEAGYRRASNDNDTFQAGVYFSF